jgi:type I restriction enzyme M protein
MPERKNQVLFVDASQFYKRGRNQNTLEPEHIAKILRLCREYKTVEGAAKLVPLAEIERNDWNLNIPRYVEPKVETQTVGVAEALENLKIALGEAYAAENRLKTLLAESGLLSGAGASKLE